MIAIIAAVIIVLVAGKTYIVLTRWQVYYVLSIFYLFKKLLPPHYYPGSIVIPILENGK